MLTNVFLAIIVYHCHSAHDLHPSHLPHTLVSSEGARCDLLIHRRHFPFSLSHRGHPIDNNPSLLWKHWTMVLDCGGEYNVIEAAHWYVYGRFVMICAGGIYSPRSRNADRPCGPIHRFIDFHLSSVLFFVQDRNTPFSG